MLLITVINVQQVPRADELFSSNQPVSLSKPESYKICECEGRACTAMIDFLYSDQMQDRNGAEQIFVIRRTVSLARSERVENSSSVEAHL